MKRLLPLLLIVILASSCKSKKVYASKKTQAHGVKVNTNKKASYEAQGIVKYAKTFNGTRYKYGGTTKRGMDCSGLIYTSFNKYNVSVPRTTSGLKNAGDWIDLKDVNVGDLVFFATKKNSRKINHVGIVSNISKGDVEFIHASSSKGVMISAISQKYWYFAFVQARRVL
ncbi:C40 family peptidase [Winogradskyella sp.]|uniref:C40 family peptidase n=1 Tax=uncultured Winogradskyella sp. TaxID=395353 RepID=UPI0023353376|nr:C40 family peptidase [Winogradskyella sp.]MDB9781917.1 C40 family peptidase [Winogradskyella sp.]MDC0007305.1 C40 family peptidase [Winogradskyella sp.]MDC0008971.1 C40 family peptidase [Winogradskyella sp.]MDC1504416.1 C40 family peptidase [Winogradskyella sp.]|tara:strand:+ start:27515 stop:28024 length:510 start_codon:yes stop_codon:yes gene_type:complete